MLAGIIEVLAVDTNKVNVVIFEHAFLYLGHEFPHATQSNEGIRR